MGGTTVVKGCYRLKCNVVNSLCKSKATRSPSKERNLSRLNYSNPVSPRAFAGFTST